LVEGIYALRAADIAAISKNMKVGNLSKAHSSSIPDFCSNLKRKYGKGIWHDKTDYDAKKLYCWHYEIVFSLGFCFE